MQIVETVIALTYGVHGILDELDVAKAEAPVDEAHAAARLAGVVRCCSLEQRVRISEEQDGGDEGGDVHEGVPREQQVGPGPPEARGA